MLDVITRDISTNDPASLTVDVRSASTEAALPAVIVVHGFRVHKDWGFLPLVCDTLAAAGMHVISYNSRLNGYEGDRSQRFDEDAFARNTVRQELQDLCDVIDALNAKTLLPSHCLHDGRVFMMGHSRGSGIALLATTKRTIHACALWSPVSSFDRYTDRQKSLWLERGYVRVPMSSRGPAFRMNAEYLHDLMQHHEEYSLTNAIASFAGDVAIIVGEQDMATPPDEARELHRAAPVGRCALHVVSATGHTFGMHDTASPLSAACAEATRITRELFIGAPTGS